MAGEEGGTAELVFEWTADDLRATPTRYRLDSTRAALP